MFNFGVAILGIYRFQSFYCYKHARLEERDIMPPKEEFLYRSTNSITFLSCTQSLLLPSIGNMKTDQFDCLSSRFHAVNQSSSKQTGVLVPGAEIASSFFDNVAFVDLEKYYTLPTYIT